jgi:hypothetical protein
VTSGRPLALERGKTIDDLRETLVAVGYTGEAVRTALGEGAYQSRRMEVPIHLRRLMSGTAVETAIKLFFLGVPVPEAEVERALAPLRVDDLHALGVIEPAGDGVLATVRLVPHADLLLAGSPYPGEGPEGIPADYVATVTAPSAILASLTVREPATAALDIGTGSGIRRSGRRATASAWSPSTSIRGR